MRARLTALAVAVTTLAGAALLSVPAEAGQSGVGRTVSLARPVPERPSVGEGWIQGKVLDRAGRPILGINVEAYAVDALQGAPVSSALTYEASYNDERGWYRLYGLVPGRYKVRYESLDTAQEYRTVWSKVVTVGERLVVARPDQPMTLARRVVAKLGLVLADPSVKPSQQASVRVTLTSPDVDPIVGTLRIRIDRGRTWTQPIRSGRVAVKLPRQGLGKHSVSVTFAGNDAVLPTKAVSTPFWVTRSGR